MYMFESRIRYSETQRGDRLSPVALVNYFQDCSTFQSESLGQGMAALSERHRAWFLSSWQIDILRLPKLGERVTVGTFPHAFQGMFGKRNFFLKDENGAFLVKANSIWVLVNTDTGKLMRVTPEDLAGFEVEEALDMEYDARKIALPAGGEAMEPFAVRRLHLDSNDHVNNAKYVEMAMEYLPGDFGVRKLRVDYKNQAHLGDVICPVVKSDNGCFYVSLNSEAGQPYAIVAMEREE